MKNLIISLYYLYATSLAVFITILCIVLDNNTRETMIFKILACLCVLWIAFTVGLFEMILSERRDKKNVKIYR